MYDVLKQIDRIYDITQIYDYLQGSDFRLSYRVETEKLFKLTNLKRDRLFVNFLN